MGYYVDLTNHEFVVAAENFPAVIQRWREFEATEEFTTRYYSSIFRPDEEGGPEPTIAGLFDAIGFEVRVDEGEDGGLVIESWGEDGNGKSWMEGEYIAAIGDLAEPGWFLDWHGEDDEHWRQSAAGTVSGELVFATPDVQALLQEAKAALAEYDDAHYMAAPRIQRAIASLRSLVKELT